MPLSREVCKVTGYYRVFGFRCACRYIAKIIKGDRFPNCKEHGGKVGWLFLQSVSNEKT